MAAFFISSITVSLMVSALNTGSFSPPASSVSKAEPCLLMCSKIRFTKPPTISPF